MGSVQQIGDLPGFYKFLASNTGKITVNRETALRHAAVFACVSAISNDLAGLPVHVLQKKDKKVQKVTGHPAYDRVKLNPNPEMRAFHWYKTRLLHVLMKGNSYTLIESSAMNPVKALWPLDPEGMSVERVTRAKGKIRGELRYKFEDGISKPKFYKAENILHLKGFSWDGINGQTVITNYAKNQIGIGLELDQFEKAFFENGLSPGGIFTHPKSINPENKPGFLKAMKKRFGGSKNRGAPMVLEDGMDFKPFEIKMVDQQFLELLKLNKIDICGIFGVPQSRISIADSNTNYNNSEQEKRRYYESGLMPWCIPDEQEMTFRLLTKADRKAGMYIKYNFDGFLRGDSKTRAEVSRIWSTMGVPVNRLLEIDDRDPVEGGDVGLVQVNMMPIKDAGLIQEVQQDNSQRSKEVRTNSLNQILSARDRVRSRYKPMISDAIETIIHRENIALAKELNRQRKQRGKSDFGQFIDKLYDKMPEYIDKSVRKLFLSYAESMQEIVAGEIALDDFSFDDISEDVRNYIDGYVNQYISSSRGQLFQQYDKEGIEAVQARVDEWREKRLDKEVGETSVGVASMVASAVILGAGHRLVWRTRGKSCPLCNQLNGRTVTKKNQSFTDKNETLKDADGRDVSFRRTLYSPLHKGCDCGVVAG